MHDAHWPGIALFVVAVEHVLIHIQSYSNTCMFCTEYMYGGSHKFWLLHEWYMNRDKRVRYHKVHYLQLT